MSGLNKMVLVLNLEARGTESLIDFESTLGRVLRLRPIFKSWELALIFDTGMLYLGTLI